ncbi:hypothetical protein QNH10_05520 [Sporosarcina thermotolerans]|nr:hypothetical protein [Sporosarcina thermotolerans]WHT49115.1 hypothetical protein QNH10_05520 [Sporosarcina thermotolerans]
MKSGMGSYQATVQHMDVEDAEMILDWYEKGKRPDPFSFDEDEVEKGLR